MTHTHMSHTHTTDTATHMWSRFSLYILHHTIKHFLLLQRCPDQQYRLVRCTHTHTHTHTHTMYSTSRKGSLTATTSTPPISRAARRTSRPMRPNLKIHQMPATISTCTAASLPVDSNLHHLCLFVWILLGMQVSWRETQCSKCTLERQDAAGLVDAVLLTTTRI